MKYTIKHDSVAQKFFTSIGGKECILRYDKISEVIWDFRMLFVPANLRGQGIAAKIVDYALNYAGKNLIKVKSSCSYIRQIFDETDKYNSVILSSEHTTPPAVAM